MACKKGSQPPLIRVKVVIGDMNLMIKYYSYRVCDRPSKAPKINETTLQINKFGSEYVLYFYEKASVL